MNLRREARWLWPIAAIVAIALACGAYILNKQRLESPLAARYTLNLQFTSADAVTPGLGAPVTVAGVAVGQIDGVALRDGRGLVHASIDPSRLPAVYADARAALIPNTPLKDMQIRLAPGTRGGPRLAGGATIPARATTTPVDADELLRALDGDTREWVQSLIASLETGLRGRGSDLRRLLRALGPTAAQMRRITRLFAQRRHPLARLVHDLRRITEATASGEDDLRRVVRAGNRTLATLAGNADPLQQSLRRLPATLAAAEATLRRTGPFATSLTRALRELDPSLEASPATLRELPGALRGLVPFPAGELRRFVDAAAPLAASVRPAARDLRAAAPLLETTFGVLERTTNLIAYMPDKHSKSYLFWLAWLAHNANSVLSVQDANGAVVRGYVMLSCSSLSQSGDFGELSAQLFGAAGMCKAP